VDIYLCLKLMCIADSALGIGGGGGEGGGWVTESGLTVCTYG